MVTVSERDSSRRPGRGLALVAGAAIAAACVVRLSHVIGQDFPVGDGGLFLVMSQDLAANGFLPPTMTSYNGGEIPFAYPPLGLYLLALTSQLIDPLTSLQWLPLLLSLLTIPVFHLLARAALPRVEAALIATSLFALMPRSFDWLIVGGGITRSLGVLFALLTLWQVVGLARGPSAFRVAAVSTLAALAVLSHPETGLFIGASSLLLVMAFADGRVRALAHLAASGLGALVLTSPWWASVLAVHGVAPFAAVAGSRDGLLPPLAHAIFLKISGAEFADIFAGLAGAALFFELGMRRWLFPAWALLAALVTPGGSAALAAIPWPLAITSAGTTLFGAAGPAYRRVTVVTTAGVLGFAIVAAGLAPWSSTSPLQTVPEGVRHAAAWARTESPPESRWAVVSPAYWHRDWSSEWFPALADRRVVTAGQGYEWVASSALRERRTATSELLDCDSIGCVERWVAERDVDYVLIVDCCGLLEELINDAGYSPVDLEAEGVLLFSTSALSAQSRGDAMAINTAAAPGQMTGMARRTPTGSTQRLS